MSNNPIKPWIEIIYLVLMQAIVIGISIYSFAYYILPWVEQFNVQRGTLMWAVTLSAVTSAFLSPVLGQWLDRKDCKKLIIISALIFSAGIVIAGFAAHYLIVITIFGLVIPIALTLCGPLMAYSLVARSSVKQKGLAMGVVATGSSVGGFLVPPLVTSLLAQYSLSTLFLCLAAIAILFIVLPAMIILDSTQPTVAESNSPINRNKKSSGGLDKQFLLSLPVWYLGIAQLAPSVLFVGLLHNIGSLAADLNIGQQEASLITALSAIVTIAGKLVFGALSDKVKHGHLYIFLCIVVSLSMIGISQASSYTALLLGASCAGFVVGGSAPMFASVVRARWPITQFGSVLGVVYAIVGFSAVGSLIAGYARDLTGSYSNAFLYMTLIMIPASLCFWRLSKIPIITPETAK